MSGVDRSESSHPNCRNEAMETRSREERRGIGGFNRGFRRYPPLLLPAFSTTQSVVPFVPLSPWRRLFVATLFSLFRYAAIKRHPCVNECHATFSRTRVICLSSKLPVSPPDNLPFFSSRLPKRRLALDQPFVFIASTESYIRIDTIKAERNFKQKLARISLPNSAFFPLLTISLPLIGRVICESPPRIYQELHDIYLSVVRFEIAVSSRRRRK